MELNWELTSGNEWFTQPEYYNGNECYKDKTILQGANISFTPYDLYYPYCYNNSNFAEFSHSGNKSI